MLHTPSWPRWLTPILLAVLAVSLFFWLLLTPDGLLGKADAIGYAICHRIADRSFWIADRPLPLCARCTGMYLGNLVGLLYQLSLGRRGGLPPRRLLGVLGLFLLLFAVDGINSYLTFFSGVPGLYPPQNGLRLATGILLGISISAILVPVFNQVAWREWDPHPAFSSWRQLGSLVGAAALVSLAIASENPLFSYPLALLSTASLAATLILAYGMLWVIILKRDNLFSNWRELLPVLILGALAALAQIALVDALRYYLTGTWNGYTF